MKMGNPAQKAFISRWQQSSTGHSECRPRLAAGPQAHKAGAAQRRSAGQPPHPAASGHTRNDSSYRPSACFVLRALYILSQKTITDSTAYGGRGWGGGGGGVQRQCDLPRVPCWRQDEPRLQGLGCQGS